MFLRLHHWLGETHCRISSGQLLAVLLGLGIASAVIQLVMNWAQRQVDPAQAAIIYAGEPVWAASDWTFGRRTLSSSGIVRRTIGGFRCAGQ